MEDTKHAKLVKKKNKMNKLKLFMCFHFDHIMSHWGGG